MVNYYNNYLKDLATVCEPLHRLMRKAIDWKWSNDCQKAFEQIKQSLCEAPILVHFDPSKPILVQCDASPYGLGIVLSHTMENGEEKPVCYASRTLSNAERNYGHVEKEGLSLVYAVTRFHQYLYGMKFLMFTDHKPLLGLFSETSALPCRAACRVLRWAILLSGYNYELKYRPGDANGNADCLSRLPLPARNGELSQKIASIALMDLVRSPVTEKEVRFKTRTDSVLSLVMRLVLEGRSQVDCENESLKPYLSRLSELSSEAGCLLWGDRVVIPSALREKVLKELHEVHPGVSRMKSLARSYVWWPNMDLEIEYLVKDCETCQQNQRCPAKSLPHHWEYLTGPWERIHIDHAGPTKGKIFLVVVDAHSKWVEVNTVRSTDSKNAVDVLRRLFAMHGLPRVLVSDNGTGFVSDEFERFLIENGIKHMVSAPYHPASNGQAERMVWTLKEALKNLKEGDTETQLCKFLFKYRITPHSATGVSPAELLVGRRLRSALSLLRPERVVSLREKQYGSMGTKKTRSFAVDEPVLIKNYGSGPEWIPGVVADVKGSVNYRVLTGDGRLIHRHVDQVQPRRAMIEGTDGVQQSDSGLPVGPESLLAERALENSVAPSAEEFSRVNEGSDAVVESSAESVIESDTVRRSSESVQGAASPSLSIPSAAAGRPQRENCQKPARYR